MAAASQLRQGLCSPPAAVCLTHGLALTPELLADALARAPVFSRRSIEWHVGREPLRAERFVEAFGRHGKPSSSVRSFTTDSAERISVFWSSPMSTSPSL